VTKARARSASAPRRKRLEARCARAAEHHRRGDLERAQALYTEVLEADGRHPAALHGLALVRRQAGDLAGAVTLLERLVAQPDADASACHNLGNLYRESGRIQDACDAYRRAVERDPRHENARFALALALLDARRPAQAVDHLERLRAAHPEDVAVLNSLGLARVTTGEPVAALACFEAATRAAPSDAASWQNCAEALLSLDRLEEALVAAERARVLAPDSAKVRRTHGHACLMMERYEDAIAQLAPLVAASPDDHLARLWLVRALTDLGRLDEALAHCEEGIRRAPRRTDLQVYRGNVLRHAGRHDDARAAYEAALALDPDAVDALNNLAFLCADEGERERAGALLRRALEIQPDAPEVWLNLVKSGDLGALDEDARLRLEASLACENLPSESRLVMHFALAQLYDSQKRYDEAFEHYARGNALKRRTVRFLPERFLQWVADIRATFDGGLLERLAGCGAPSERPVFIVGMPRSGTTLVEQILASHPDVFGADELTRITELAEGLRGAGGVEYPRAAAALECAHVGQIADDYLGYLASLNTDALRVTDKMPSNHFHLGLIGVMFPNARIVHCRRDPMDVCLSNFIQLFGGGHYYSYSLDDIAVYYNAYVDLMAYWHALLPGRILDVRYEALVEHQERESRRLVDWLGLHWDERCLAFHSTRRTVRTASHHQVRQPIYRSARGRWRRYEKHLAGLRAAIGAEAGA
jgi:tetratricopeptide (TPR) repeat protein